MKSLIVLSVFVAVAVAAPATLPEKPPVTIIRNEIEKSPDGSFHFVYELSDGTSREERGVPIPGPENEEKRVVVEGVYRFINDEGTPIEVHYKADENGYVPEGGDVNPAITANARTISEGRSLQGRSFQGQQLQGQNLQAQQFQRQAPQAQQFQRQPLQGRRF